LSFLTLEVLILWRISAGSQARATAANSRRPAGGPGKHATPGNASSFNLTDLHILLPCPALPSNLVAIVTLALYMD
jgi:hypothetical protein